jgi:hypothetical protein
MIFSYASSSAENSGNSNYKSLEKTEKIRILVGISLNRYAYELIQKANPPSPLPDGRQAGPFSKGGMGGFLHFSHSEAKDDFKSKMGDVEQNGAKWGTLLTMGQNGGRC